MGRVCPHVVKHAASAPQCAASAGQINPCRSGYSCETGLPPMCRLSTASFQSSTHRQIFPCLRDRRSASGMDTGSPPKGCLGKIQSCQGSRLRTKVRMSDRTHPSLDPQGLRATSTRRRPSILEIKFDQALKCLLHITDRLITGAGRGRQFLSSSIADFGRAPRIIDVRMYLRSSSP